MQESKLAEDMPPIEAARFMPPVKNVPAPDLIGQAANVLRHAKRPVILAGRVSRDFDAWKARIALAEAVNAQVATDLKVAAAFPTHHPLHVGSPGTIGMTSQAVDAIREADAILSLDWVDVAGTLKSIFGATVPSARVVQVSVDHYLHNGWSMDYQGLPPVDVFIDCEPDVAVPALLDALGPQRSQTTTAHKKEFPKLSDDKLTVDHLADALRRAVGQRPTSLTHVSLSWNGASWAFNHPLDYLGSDGGGGVGGGPGISVGAALALRGSGRLPVAVCGDGDFLMGVTALWTAAHYRIPLLIVVANNRSFFNDELHQERTARMRNRPVENRWVGQRISEPDIDLAAMARAQGAEGFGPVNSIADLQPIFEKAIATVESGAIAVVDVRVEPGYTAAMTAAMTRKSE
jgi:thiamine pyrophosphate-dependent acetolactate synthase large subunit-like protein